MLRLKKIIKLIGIITILIALLANPFIVRYLSPDNTLTTLTTILIVFFEIILLFIGAYLYKKPREYKNVLLVLIILLVLWLPSDFIVTKVKFDVPFRQENSIYHHSFVPSSSGIYNPISQEFTTSYEINSHGLRNPEIPSKTDKTRILMLGDSFTEGQGVNYEDTIAKKLNNYLEEDFEVINAGVASYSPTLEYLYLINNGINLQPDIVILNFDISDIHDDIIRYLPQSTFKEQQLTAVKPEKIRNFHFTQRIGQILGIFKTDRPLDISQIGDIRFDKEFHTRLNSCEEFEKEWQQSFKFIKKIKENLDSSNIPLYITIYPWAHQVTDSQWVEGRSRRHFENKIYPFAIEDCFENYTYGTELNIINLLSDFEEAVKTDKIYYDIDMHMTKEGYEVFAKGIYKELK